MFDMNPCGRPQVGTDLGPVPAEDEGGKSGGEPADKPGSVVDSHSSRAHVTVRLKRPTRGPARAARCDPKGPPAPLFGLAPEWGLPCHRCYHRRGALLPHLFNLTAPSVDGGWRYIFCGTFRGLAPPRHYLAPCPMEPGLSSPSGLHLRRRLSGRLPAAVYPADSWGPSTIAYARRDQIRRRCRSAATGHPLLAAGHGRRRTGP